MSDCTHDCGSCSSNCQSREGKNPFLLEMNENSDIRHVIGVVSGKGGVGKSLVTSMLASAVSKRGFQTAILDADITGPSIPKSFGIRSKATGTEEGWFPVLSPEGIEIMSLNLITEEETDPVVWRGPVIAGVVKQFWTDVHWGDIDYMFVDMPPGTGDVPLTVFQSLPVDGLLVVTSPQELVSTIVAKAVNMANAMNIPILGLIENYSYVECPDCGKKLNVFGESHVADTCNKFGIRLLAQLPLNPEIAGKVDKGEIEDLESELLDPACDLIEGLFEKEQ